MTSPRRKPDDPSTATIRSPGSTEFCIDVDCSRYGWSVAIGIARQVISTTTASPTSVQKKIPPARRRGCPVAGTHVPTSCCVMGRLTFAGSKQRVWIKVSEEGPTLASVGRNGRDHGIPVDEVQFAEPFAQL